MIVTNNDAIVVFDEFGWDIKPSPLSLAKDLVSTAGLVETVEFVSQVRTIIMRCNATCGLIDFFFRDPDHDLLNFFCQFPEFRIAVKQYYIHAELPSFPAGDYSLLAATILGNNEH